MAIVNRDQILSFLPSLGRFAREAKVMTILSHVKVDFGDRGLALTTTDLEGSASAVVPYDRNGDKPGAITVPFTMFERAMRNIATDELSVSIQGQRLVVSYPTGENRVSMSGMDAEEFPQIDFSAGDFIAEVDVDVIAKTVAPVVSRDTTRPILQGVNIGISPDGFLAYAATDGFRLAVYKTDVKPDNSFGVTIPARIFKATSGLSRLLIAENSATFECGDALHVRSQLLSNSPNQYPNYWMIIPKLEDGAEIDLRALKDAVRIATVCSDDELHKISVKIEDGKASVFSNGIEGDARAVVPVSGKLSHDYPVNLNARYFSDALDAFAALNASVVVLHQRREIDALLIDSPDVPQYMHVIMPMR